jgi:hypothetical protein
LDSTVNKLGTIEDLLGMEPLGLNDGLQPPISDVFTRELHEWNYESIVPEVLRTTKLPLLPGTAVNQIPASRLHNARPPHDATDWAAKMRGFDFTRSVRLDTARFSHLLWEGLCGKALRKKTCPIRPRAAGITCETIRNQQICPEP